MGKEGKEKILFFERTLLDKDQPYGIHIQKIGRTAIHWHEGVTEILLSLRGTIRVTAAVESWVLREGEFCFINHRSIHSLQSEEGALGALIHVNLSYFSPQFPDLPYMFFRSNPVFDSGGKIEEGFTDISPEEKLRFRALLIDLLRHDLSPEPSAREKRNLGNRLIYAMVYDFNWLRFLKSTEGLVHSAHLERYHRIVRYIQEHYAERITLEDIVAKEFVTKTYFSQFWKKFSRYNFTQRVNYERILKSEFLLLSGHNVLKISEYCGFSDVKYFYQSFKRWYGCLPREHRKRCLEYSLLGVSCEEVTPTRSRVELERFVDRLRLEGKVKLDQTNPTVFREGYKKMKKVARASAEGFEPVSIFLLDPFGKEIFTLGEKEEMDFQWLVVDKMIELATESEVPIAVGLLVDGVDPRIFYEGTGRFLEGALNRYGRATVRQWTYQVYYEDPGNFDKSLSIEKLIGERVKGAKIRHFFGIGLKLDNH